MKLHWLVIVFTVIIGSALVGAPPGLRIANATNYASVDAGAQHTCALMTSNAIQCWGRNDGGQLGNGTVVGSATAVPVSGLGTTATAVVTGGWHTCALVTGGGVKCWGLNGYGQVGDGTTLDRATPTTVCASGSGPTCSPLTNVKAVAAGFSHTCCHHDIGGGQVLGPELLRPAWKRDDY